MEIRIIFQIIIAVREFRVGGVQIILQNKYLCVKLVVMPQQSIWDPLRKKMVAETPEEDVRQWFVKILNEQAGVPMHLMMSEVAFSFGEKDYRADILVYGRKGGPVMAVECKRVQTELSQNVLDQILRYNMTLNVRYLVITNGKRTVVCEKGEDGYSYMNHFPDFEEMNMNVDEMNQSVGAGCDKMVQRKEEIRQSEEPKVAKTGDAGKVRKM